jgi:tetrahydromethanopterin S-methyltransferase subunit A
MSKFDENMSEIFDTDPINKQIEQLPIVQQEPELLDPKGVDKILQDDLMKDYEASRRALRDIVSKGNNAIDDILEIARESEHPRAFEVAATMIKNVAEVNEKLINLQKQMKDITGAKNQAQLNVGKAAIFVGSTAELSKMIKNEIKTIDNE